MSFKTKLISSAFAAAALWMPVSSPMLASPAESAAAVRAYVQEHQHAIVDELVTFLQIPNVTGKLPDIQQNARHIEGLLQKRGIVTRIAGWETAPLVIGHLKVEGAERTLLVYAHYDGQPVDEAKWVGTSPFQAALRSGPSLSSEVLPYPRTGAYEEDWRIFARSASDDKSPIIAMLAALDGMTASGLQPSSNLIFIFEGEEESSSPNLARLLRENRDDLAADAVIVADGPVFMTGQPTAYFGARGIVTMDVTVVGPNRSLHSGHYGNWAPNPAWILADLLASMKDRDGKVLVEGFYDDVLPLGAFERKALEQVPAVEEQLKREYGFAFSEGNRSLMEAINLPSLNVRGLLGGWVGDEARTIVPSRATASIDLRLVESVRPEEQVSRVVEHIHKQGFRVIDREPTPEELARFPRIAIVKSEGGYAAHRTPMDHPICRRVVSALEESLGDSVFLPTLGGSVPLYVFKEELQNGVIIGLPIVNHDNNQHSPNENLRLGNFFTGIEAFAAIFSM